jgi:hypothetical protein
MKKFFLIIIAAFIVLAVNSQTITMSTGSGTYAFRATGFVISAATAQWTQINGYVDWASSLDFQCRLDSTSGNHTNVAVALYGRKFSSDAWTQIGSTVNWKGTTADTTITISTTSVSRWREYKALYTGTGAASTTTISNQYFKLWHQ